MQVEFEYTDGVYSPARLRGGTCENDRIRLLELEDAQMLAEQNYGRITNLYPAGTAVSPAETSRPVETVDEVPKREKRKRNRKVETGPPDEKERAEKEGDNNDGPDKTGTADPTESAGETGTD